MKTMKNKKTMNGNCRWVLSVLILLTPTVSTLAQITDTTWVNTLNFGDITNRRGTYQFPAAQQWQKIRMHYTLKCDPQTKQDGYNCGEWDYLSYIIVNDSTGRIDSNRLTHSNFMVGDMSPDSYGYLDNANNTQQIRSINKIVDQVILKDSFVTGSGNISSRQLSDSRRAQYLFTAAELHSLGMDSGKITALTLEINQGLHFFSNTVVRLASTNESSLHSFVDLGNSAKVFQGQQIWGSAGELVLPLIDSFVWDGKSNLVLEVFDPNKEDSHSSFLCDSSAMGVYANAGDFNFRFSDNSFLEVQDGNGFYSALDSQITIAFWAFGDDALPQNTSVLEAINADGKRVLNVHLPWSDGQIYWDAGNDNGSYDRINKSASSAEIKNQWNYWAFVKDAQTGLMAIYLNGNLWHSATLKTRSVKGLTRLRIGKGISANQYKGRLDNITIWNSALTKAEINDLMKNEITASHSKISNLLLNLTFDNLSDTKPYELNSVVAGTDAIIWGSMDVNEEMSEFKNPFVVSTRPKIKWFMGDEISHLDTQIVNISIPVVPVAISLFENLQKPADYTASVFGVSENYSYTFDPDGNKIDSTGLTFTSTLTKTEHEYFVPYEVVNNIEIGRYITPYGIGLDLGPDGFKWIYDVTDYAYLLTDRVTLSAGNQQELIDLRFEFIPGETPRDVKRIDYYANQESRLYRDIDDDKYFKSDTISLSADAKTFKLITRITGHGHNTDAGKDHCCEWANKTHYMKINGEDALEWDIWQNDKCALNPVIDQGGNWAPPRAGWCPGAPVDDYVFDVTQYAQSGQMIFDYQIEPVPTDNLGQGGGNYVVSFHLVEYGDWKHVNDATVENIIKPNDWEFYNRMNPTCELPKIVIRNTGSANMKSALLRYGVSDGNPIVFGWKGELKPDESDVVDLPFAIWDYLSPTHSTRFYAEIVDVNGVEDEYAGNNRSEANFKIPDVVPTTVELWFRNNSLPDASVKLMNDRGDVIYEKADAAAGELVKQTLNLDPGCYTLTCETENEFGLYYPLIPEVGSGLLRMMNANAGFVQNFNPDFGKSIEYHFTVAYSLPAKTVETHDWKVYPNPTSGLLMIEDLGNTGDVYRIEILNMTGQVVWQSDERFSMNLNTIDLSNLSSGIYNVRLFTEGKQQLTRIQIQ
ncbi:MAG: T9SS type A sorting domain-containing protein [Bacteroidetes bacterium]|nr:T9SS type A sorting domain-containing protein [Bacteroidota bacterium]